MKKYQFRAIKDLYNMKYIVTKDGTNTLYSKQFNQYYHSMKEGALNEALYKHVVPALQYHQEKIELTILDICFGLGYNTLATIYYIQKNNLNIKLNIYSAEFDKELLDSLKDFPYPKEFALLQNIINSLSKHLHYEDKNCIIEIYNGDAREYLDILYNRNIQFDIVFQDAFSSEVNKLLWTQEYFKEMKKVLSDDAIITTYSIATPIRLSIYNNGINIYEYKPTNTNKITIALTKKSIDNQYKYIDMELKQKRNTTAVSLKDKG